MPVRSVISYKKAGVDIAAAERMVQSIRSLARKTHRPGLVAGVGGFSALFSLPRGRYRNPILVSSTDGVGTKLKIGFMTGVHRTVGIDLVAMGVNDILTQGAEPLFFLDYLATGKLKPKTALEVIRGLVEGCRRAECTLIWGQTAEMDRTFNNGLGVILIVGKQHVNSVKRSLNHMGESHYLIGEIKNGSKGVRLVS